MMDDYDKMMDEYDKRILARRYGYNFDCDNCGRSWKALKEDIILSHYSIDAKLRCPYCHNMITIPRIIFRETLI